MKDILVPIAAVLITAIASYLVARVSRRTAKESQGVQALSESVDAFRELLIETRKTHDDRIADMQRQIDRHERTTTQQRTDLDAIAEQKNELATRVTRMERALDAARRYISTLLATLTAHSITPPDPPADYLHQEAGS